jgi:hypothetical protein
MTSDNRSIFGYTRLTCLYTSERAEAESRDFDMDLIKTQLIESVFAGGGEMGARMRAFDWSTTALGPVEQ